MVTVARRLQAAGIQMPAAALRWVVALGAVGRRCCEKSPDYTLRLLFAQRRTRQNLLRKHLFLVLPTAAAPLDFAASPALQSWFHAISYPPLLLALFCGLATMAAHAIELAKYPRSRTGPQGIEVVLAPSADSTQALVRVSGINHAIDQVVFWAPWSNVGLRAVYVTRLDGRDYGLLHRQASRYGGSTEHVLYLPGQRDGIALAFSDKKSKEFRLAALQASYAEQQKQGVQENWPASTEKNGEPVCKRISGKQTRRPLQPVAPRSRPRWTGPPSTTKTANPEHRQLCGVVASEMESLCRGTPDFKPLAATLGQIRCQFASRLKIRVDNQQVVFSTEKEAPNQSEFVRQFLRNQ